MSVPLRVASSVDLLERPEPRAAFDARTRSIAVATWNIHRGVGSDRRHDIARIARVMRELDVALIGLQEVDARPSRRPDQFAELQAHTGWNGTLGGPLRGPKGAMRTALFTPHEIVGERALDLGDAQWGARGAVDADIRIGSDVIRVVVVHLGLRVVERNGQVARLVAALEGETRPLVLLGDFNEWHLHRATLAPLDQRFGPSTPVPSFPARFPLLSLDRIWSAPGAFAVNEVGVHTSPLARRASDHLPVRAVLRPNPPL